MEAAQVMCNFEPLCNHFRASWAINTHGKIWHCFFCFVLAHSWAHFFHLGSLIQPIHTWISMWGLQLCFEDPGDHALPTSLQPFHLKNGRSIIRHLPSSSALSMCITEALVKEEDASRFRLMYYSLITWKHIFLHLWHSWWIKNHLLIS